MGPDETSETFGAPAPRGSGGPAAAGLVSVVIPCYNAAPFVAETIESVLSQSYGAVEIVAVDDASTDASWSVIERYADRVRTLRLPANRGGSHARNRGAELTRGEYLMFLDSDDLIAPDTLERLVATARDQPGVTAICAWERLRKVEGSWIAGPADVPLPSPEADPLPQWLESRWVPPCAVLWRREVYERTGGWDEEVSYDDDGDLMMRSFVRGARLAIADGGRAYYRDHGANRLSVGTDFSSAAKLRSGMRVVEKLGEELTERGELERYAVAIGVRYHRLALFGFQNGYRELARECVRRGVRLAGRRAVSHTGLGRSMERVVGLERKEALAQWLAARGLMSFGRRLITRRRQLSRPAAEPTPDAPPTLPAR